MDMTPQAWPDWYDGKHINEVLFCQQFLDKHPMKCVRGRLFTVDGLIEDEGQIGNLILEEISGVLTSGLSKVVTNLLASIKLQAYSPPLPIETDRIHVSNGTYFIDGSFTVVKSYCNNRLTVAYNPDAPTPKKWLQFLSELLQPEDIPTLQEFLGYCLLPTTKGQKMLMLIGKGGEGKSRIGLVMRSLLGDSMNTTSIQKVESNRFSRADLENKLLMVDDDMDMSALPKTNYIKSIVTSECKMDMERKGVQSYQSQLYVRFLCFGNGALTALHDKSDGFFRRQIVLTTKDRPAGRADDPFLVDKLLREKEGIRNLFNEWYARDISKKRRISNKIKGNSGEPMGLPPYGYIKDPNNPKHWVIDEEAAQVVRRIFDMTLEGFGTEQIATQFEKEGVLTPQAYWIQKGIGRPGRSKIRPATKWNGSTITHLLYQQEYCGDVLNFKTYSKSYKNKKRIHNDPENWVVFQNVHEPIIERAVFEQVQQKRGKMRKRRTSNGEHNMFSGLLVCADCGCNLHFHFNQGNPEIKYFNCSNYKGNRGTCQSTHYIRVDFLEEVVLGEIRRLTKFASLYEDDFLKAVIGHSQQADEADRKLKEKELKALLARDEELDGLFERIYEDNVSGKISDERFSRMSRRYEDEQKELTEKIKQLRSEIEKQSSRTMTTDMFISLVRKYTRAKKLTPRMLNELVEKIEVFNAEKVNGVWEQRLRIHYNCVGTIEIPSALPLPTPDVSVNTRKGVVVNYAPCDIAI